MSQPALYPLLLDPALHVKVWGGRKLETLMHKTLPTDEPYGESWEMHDTARIANGALAGQTVAEVLGAYGHDLVGVRNDPAEGMPLLAKILDANDWLSIQVHPNDEQAKRLENDPRGKTEAWYVIAAEPGAKLVIGVQPGTTKAQMSAAIRDNTLEDLVVYAEVKPGDLLFVAANTVHALGPGILIYEIQQSSDITYRLYDWGRMDLNGKPRTLHIDKGVEVSRLDSLPTIQHLGEDTSPEVVIVESPYFHTRLHRLNGHTINLNTDGVFHILTCIEGEATVAAHGDEVPLTTGRSILIPAALDAYTLGGRGQVLRSFQPL